MSDELKDIFETKTQRRPGAANPILRMGPCVKGGLPLDGGPKLDLPADGVIVQREDAHASGAPHLSIHHLDDEPDSAEACPIAAEAPKEQEAAGTAPGDGDLRAVALEKSYRKGPISIPVLRGVDLEVRRGEFLAIVGQSGSGKSTLLHLLGTLDAPDAGAIHFDGRRIDNLPGSQRDALRNRRLGMIFQFYHLLPELTTLENVLAPLMITESAWGYFRHRRRHRQAAAELLEMVGLGHRLKHKPRELSGGEMQRAAIARALVAGPDLLLADEPTGNLDHATGEEIMTTLASLNEQQNLTIVMVTHDQAIADRADRIVRLVDGRIAG